MDIEQLDSLAFHTYCDTGIRYNGHLRGPVTLTPIAERLAMTYVCRGWDSNTQPSPCGSNALTHCAIAAARTINGPRLR